MVMTSRLATAPRQCGELDVESDVSAQFFTCQKRRCAEDSRFPCISPCSSPLEFGVLMFHPLSLLASRLRFSVRAFFCSSSVDSCKDFSSSLLLRL